MRSLWAELSLEFTNYCPESALLCHSSYGLQFPGGVVSYDGVPTEKDVSVDLSLTVIFSILATVGIAFAVACLTFNFIFRDKRWVHCTLSNLHAPAWQGK